MKADQADARRTAAIQRDTITALRLAMPPALAVRFNSLARCMEAHILTRGLGEGGGRGWPDMQDLELRPGDRLLLCSDGLHSFTPEEEIRRVLAGDGAPEAIVHELVELALRGEARDNISAVVVAVEGG